MSDNSTSSKLSALFGTSKPSPAPNPNVFGMASSNASLNHWTKLKTARGVINSDDFVANLENIINQKPPTHEQWAKMIQYWKSFSLDPAQVENIEKENYRNAINPDSVPHANRKAAIAQVMEWIRSIRQHPNYKQGALTWGTLARVKLFSDKKEVDAVMGMLYKSDNPNKPLVYSRWIVNIASFDQSLKLYVGKWLPIIQLVDRHPERKKVDAGHQPVEGVTIYSAYWDFNLIGEPAKPTKSYDIEYIYKHHHDLTDFELLACAATPDVRKLLQCPEIRQGKNVADLQSQVADIMNSIVVMGGGLSASGEVDVSSKSTFSDDYYTMVSVYATTMRQLNRKYFQGSNGANTRDARQRRVNIGGTNVFQL